MVRELEVARFTATPGSSDKQLGLELGLESWFRIRLGVWTTVRDCDCGDLGDIGDIEEDDRGDLAASSACVSMRGMGQIQA